MATLKEIAEATHVSIRTVSRALNDSGYVNPQKKVKILTVAEKLMYRPNRIAKSLRMQKSFEIIVVTGSLDELHIAKLAGLEQAMREAGYSVSMLFLNHQDESVKEKYYDRELIHEIDYRHPAALALLAFPDNEIIPWVRYLNGNNIPYIVFDTSAQVDTVRIDRTYGIYSAVMYLAEKGKKRIAYLGPRVNDTRTAGYRQAMEELKQKPIFLRIEQAEIGQFDPAPGLSRYLQMKERPDAVQAYSDEVAMKFMSKLHDLSIKIPLELSVIGFDNRWAAALSWPRLTTVAQPNYKLGIASAEILLRKIRGETPPKEGWSRILPTELIIRDSA
ncbi:MAG: LacI family DNA-binding transcriptional regulator [Spirochaetota bacterium]